MMSAVSTTNSLIVRWILLTFAILLFAFAVWLIRDIVMLTLTAVILALLLTTPVRFFVRRGIRRPIAILMTVVLLIGVITTAGFLVLPDLFKQFRTLVTVTIPSASERLQDELRPEKITQTFPFLQGVDLVEFTDQLSDQLLGGLADVTSQVFPFVGSLASTLISILIVLFLGLYFIADPGTHQRGMIKLLPLSYRARAYEILVILDKALRRFLQAQLVLMLVIGVGTAVALWMMGVPLWGALGTITGVFSFVPNFGPLVALIPILAVAIINTPDKTVARRNHFLYIATHPEPDRYPAAARSGNPDAPGNDPAVANHFRHFLRFSRPDARRSAGSHCDGIGARSLHQRYSW
jgi:predicted PurR-regulated permease PerM